MATGKPADWDYLNNRPMEKPEVPTALDAEPADQSPVLRCGKYELRELPDGLIEVHDPADDISFVLSDAAIDGFMFAGKFMLANAPPTE